MYSVDFMIKAHLSEGRFPSEREEPFLFIYTLL